MDVNLTHSHKIVVYATTCYNIAIAHLINNFGDSEGAINRVDKYIENLKKADELKHHWSKIMNAKDENELIRADKKIGYIMIAFTYAFFYLKNNFTYQDAIESMLMKGGIQIQMQLLLAVYLELRVVCMVFLKSGNKKS